MEELITLRYEGGTVERGEMDAYSVSEAIGGFADFMRHLSAEVYGSEAEMKAAVRGFHSGSFEIVMLFQHIQEGAALLSAASATGLDVLDLVKWCVDLMKHLGGDAPKSIKNADNGSVMVENNSGVINNYPNATIINIVLKPTVGRSAGKFVRGPLTRSAETLEVFANDKSVARVSRDEAKSFTEIESGDILTEHVAEVWLLIRTVVLHGDGRWSFNDGRASFSAPIADEEFRTRIEAGEERFGKGDSLLVQLRSIQKRVRGELRAEYVVEKVLDHKRATGQQGRLV